MGIDGISNLLPTNEPKTVTIYVELNGSRQMIGEATVCPDGQVHCSLADNIEYVGNFSGYVSGFDFEIPVSGT